MLSAIIYSDTYLGFFDNIYIVETDRGGKICLHYDDVLFFFFFDIHR